MLLGTVYIAEGANNAERRLYKQDWLIKSYLSHPQQTYYRRFCGKSYSVLFYGIPTNFYYPKFFPMQCRQQWAAHLLCSERQNSKQPQKSRISDCEATEQEFGQCRHRAGQSFSQGFFVQPSLEHYLVLVSLSKHTYHIDCQIAQKFQNVHSLPPKYHPHLEQYLKHKALLPSAPRRVKPHSVFCWIRC